MYGLQFSHRVAYYNYYESSAGDANKPCNVKKKTKEQRREAKAAANRARAHIEPHANKSKKKKKSTSGAPSKPDPPPHQATVKITKFRPRSTTFGEFEAAFASFEHAVLAAGACFRVCDVPRPPVADAIGAAGGACTSESKFRLLWRKSVLMWHPDKWARVSDRADDAGLLSELTQSMTRAVLREKERRAE